MPDRLLIVSVFIVASCGLAYELIAAALTSYLLGDSILQFSSVIGCYLFAMGVGSHLSRYVSDENALERFVDIELLVGIIGGMSAALLFLVYAWADSSFRIAMYGIVFLVGMLVGMEIPLVMRILGRQNTSLRELVSRVLTFDYLGALAVSLLFPLLLAPRLGLARTAFLFGMMNAGVALWAAWSFQAQLQRAKRRLVTGAAVVGLLVAGFMVSEPLTQWAERGLFGDEIIYAKSTPYQRLVLTRWKDDLRLYINSNLQFSSRDERRYHEALVHPVMNQLPWARRVLVLGGGDGLAVRELLRYKELQQITLVDLDSGMTALFSRSPLLTALNKHSLTDPRVHIINADAALWLEQNRDVFDAIIVDFPDPSNFGLGKLYSVPMYKQLTRHLSENGYAVIQSTSPYFAPRSFWCIDATLHEAGLNTWPYHAYVPSFGEWGFIIASRRSNFSPPVQYRLPMQFLDAESTALMFHFPKDMQAVKVEPNRLNTQMLVHYFEQDWSDVIR